MVASWIILIFAVLAFLLFLIMTTLSFIFWLEMATDALKIRDNLWITLLMISFVTGLFSGLAAYLYYEIMYKDEEGHHRPSRSYKYMVISTLLFVAVFVVLILMLVFDGGEILNQFFSQFLSLYSF
ncbi:MAG: hypothetical protein HGA85_04110 [Nanoarchaeota archaeon]|nr:hypothetical protein [Nanoarchaeota archaeon]